MSGRVTHLNTSSWIPVPLPIYPHGLRVWSPCQSLSIGFFFPLWRHNSYFKANVDFRANYFLSHHFKWKCLRWLVFYALKKHWSFDALWCWKKWISKILVKWRMKWGKERRKEEWRKMERERKREREERKRGREGEKQLLNINSPVKIFAKSFK